jgi:uncharacterized protein
MPHFDNTDWIIVGLAALLIGISKTGIPGLGILAVLMMAWVMPARASTGVILPMLIVGDIFAVAYYKRHAVWKHLVWLIPWAMAGIFIGYEIMKRITDHQLRPLIGLIILVLLAVNYWRNSKTNKDITIPTQWWFAAIMGLTAGITTQLANAAGPIMIIYLMAMQLPKNEFLGTGAWYYLLMNSFKVPFSTKLGLINPNSLSLNLVGLPFIMIGAMSGVRILKIIPEKAFAVAIQILAVAAAAKLALEIFHQ